MTAVDAVATWDPEASISAAKELIHASNYAKVDEARESLNALIADWVRVASKDPLVAADAALKARAVAAILRVWSLYAALEIELRQFKQATKIFETGTLCPFAGPNVAFWLQYADFCIERKKLSNARKVFVRALRAVPEANHGEIWTRFHAFVVEHLDPNMSLASLETQVFPEKDFSAATPKPVVESPPVTGAVVEKEAQKEVPASTSVPVELATKAPVVPEPRPVQPVAVAASTVPVPSREQAEVPRVDPSLAFVDKQGVETPVAAPHASLAAGSKRKASDIASDSPVKQAKVDNNAESTALATDEDIKSFLQLPTTLPITPGCPHLLFDQMENQRVIDNELLERLSTVLSDNAVFQGVKDLFDNQRQRDRDMLYRWQDLVGMQMKEGSELFARHAGVEKEKEKGVAEPQELIELKNKNLETRREFVHRCQMSQQQFIEISEMDRTGALKAQQISLENMKIPEMTVTSDANVIELQRAIVGLILETEKLSREESLKKPDYHARGKKPNFVPRGGPGYPRSDSRDRGFVPRGGGRGGRAGFGRGGGSFGRNGGGRRPFSPPRGGRGPPKRHDGYAPHSAPAPRTYDAAPPRQTQPAYQGNSHRNYAQGPSHGRGYSGDIQPRDRPAQFDRGQDRRPQSYGRGPPSDAAAPPPHRFADAPRAHTGPPNGGHYDSQDSYRRPAPHVGGRGGRGGASPARHVEYDRGDRYGAPQHAAPVAAPPVSRYGSEPPAAPQRYNAPPPSYDYAPPASAPYAYQSQPPPQQQPPVQRTHYGQPPPVYQQPPPQQHYQPPPQQQQHGYDAPPPSYQPPPHHAQQQPHHQPPQHHRQPYQTSPPRGGGGGRGGYDRFRRGGGGGGRYGRR